jgi:hypothetical protein
MKAPDVDGQILRDYNRLKALGKRRAAKQVFTPAEDLEESYLYGEI